MKNALMLWSHLGAKLIIIIIAIIIINIMTSVCKNKLSEDVVFSRKGCLVHMQAHKCHCRKQKQKINWKQDKFTKFKRGKCDSVEGRTMYQNMHHHSHLIFNLVFGRDKGPPLKDTAGQSASPPLDTTTRFTSTDLVSNWARPTLQTAWPSSSISFHL